MVFVCGVLSVFFECCDALFEAFRDAKAFNADLSKWETFNVTSLSYSKCTVLGAAFFFQTRIQLYMYRRLTLLVVFWGLDVVSCGVFCRSL